MKGTEMTTEQKQLIEEFADNRSLETFEKLADMFPEDVNYLGLYIFVVMYGELKHIMTREHIIKRLTMVIEKMNKENDKPYRKDSEQVGF